MLNQLLASAGNLITVGGGGPTLRVANPIGGQTVSIPVDGSRTIVSPNLGTKVGQQGLEIRQSVSPAVPQSDDLKLIQMTANGATLVYDLGRVEQFLDVGATALPFGDVVMIDPNGTPHDLAAFTKLKTSGDGFNPPQLPPGRYTFLNISGGSLAAAGHVIVVQHVGSRNLA